jgi:hypothetical protein
MPLTEDDLAAIERIARENRMTPPVDVLDLLAELHASQAEARLLRAALAWYGEPRNYRVSSAASVNKIAWWPVVRDAGARTRATLAPAREGT